VPDPEIYSLSSKRGWPKIAYDKSVWIPCPDRFEGRLTRDEWAKTYASLWWQMSGFKYGKRQVKGLEKALLELQRGTYATQPCHSVVIHLPNVDVMPLPVCVATWEAIGDRETQLRELVHADEPEAVEAPLVEPFTAEKLGTGLKSQYLQRFQRGTELTGVVNYAWRVQDMETDVRVFTACGDLSRLQAAMPDIDALTSTISVEPL
jgi:hypothetical protein